ncbi:gluconokinase [Alicyclobacillus sp. SO9]|uniref:gluconokinase n=1 Tax=Alicyclobacillus sp. SO9 TaxID=2665646 RepID=UPI0018E8DBF9|nr:gluconokinase [Alicyclobacillus sp. SO9]QQE78145.1 gluconokinase [Alicyclobacillus sp. SO9]
MTDKSCILGIDIGTTSVKAVAFDMNKNVLVKNRDELNLIVESNYMAEQDPHEVYEKLTLVMEKTISAAVSQGRSIAMVGFSSAMHSLLLVSSDGTPVGNAMTWMDGRAARTANEIWNTKTGRELYYRTGTPVHAMSPMVKLVWLQDVMPSEFQSTGKFVSLKEWVWYQWFGVWEVDESIASATGLLNLQTRQWDEQALEFVKVRTSQLSQIVKTKFSRRGCQEERLLDAGLTKNTRFGIGASDGVLANLGVGAVQSGSIALTMGTSIAVRLLSEKPQTHEAIRSFCYILDDSRFVVGGPSNSGGIVLDWIYSNVAVKDMSMTQAIDAAKTVSTDGLYCLPYVSGERSPLWDSEARASFVGLTLQHNGLHMLRAGIEGILFNAYWIASELFEQVGKPHVLIASGKLFEVVWVRQLLADIFDIPVRVNFLSDASILGAVDLAEHSDCQSGAETKQLEAERPVQEALQSENVKEEVFFPKNPLQYKHKYQQFRKTAAAFQELSRAWDLRRK